MLHCKLHTWLPVSTHCSSSPVFVEYTRIHLGGVVGWGGGWVGGGGGAELLHLVPHTKHGNRCTHLSLVPPPVASTPLSCGDQARAFAAALWSVSLIIGFPRSVGWTHACDGLGEGNDVRRKVGSGVSRQTEHTRYSRRSVSECR